MAAIDPSAKTEMSQAGKKMKRITTILGKVSEALNEMQHTPKPQEYAEHPKINVVTLNPTALTPQEVGSTNFLFSPTVEGSDMAIFRLFVKA